MFLIERKSILFVLSLALHSIHAATLLVNDPSDPMGTLTDNTLRWAIINANSGDTIQINVASPINLSYPLPAITQQNLTITAISPGPATIDGQGAYSIFSVVQPSTGDLALQNLILTNGASYGGSGGAGGSGGNSGGGGGGGGAGGGGGLYVHNGSKIALQNVTITNCSANGGMGGGLTTVNGGGGGGGFGSSLTINQGGDGSPNNKGGGGGGGGGSPWGGQGGTNGDGVTGGLNIVVSGGGGGGSGSGAAKHNGGSAYFSYNANPNTNAGGSGKKSSGGGGGGAGVGGAGGDEDNGNGGTGGFGIGPDQYFGGGGGGGTAGGGGFSGGSGFGTGGGGGAYQGYGGDGGALGGGGGGASNGGAGGYDAVVGGRGGLGGGGGGGVRGGGGSIFGGGTGGYGVNSNSSGGAGGGGAAMGGSVFIHQNAIVTIQDGTTIQNGQLHPGLAGTQTGGTAATSGGAYGPDIFLCSGGTLIFTNSGSLTIATNIDSDQGAGGGTGGGLTMNGSGTTTLQGTNSTYTGTTTINSGTLSLISSGGIGPSSNVVINNSTLQVTSRPASGGNNFAQNYSLLGNAVIDIGADSTPRIYPTTIQGVVNGTGSLIKIGAGELDLINSSNSYSGGTFIQGGVLGISDDSNLGTGSLSIDNATFALLRSYAVTSNRSISLSGSATVSVIFGSWFVDGSISGSGSLIKTGASLLALETTNSYTGSTTISVGTLALNGPSNSISSSSYVYVNSGAFLNLGSNQTIQDLTGASLGTVSLNSYSLTLGSSNGGDQVFAGNIVGTGSIIKQGTSTEVFQGINTYSGNTSIQDGTLRLEGSTNSLPNSPVVSISSGGVLALGSNQTIHDLTGDGNVSLGTFQLTFGGSTSTPQTFSGQISDSGSIVKAGTGTAILTGNSNYTGGTTLGSGTLQIGQDASLGTGGLTVTGNSTLAIGYSSTMSHPIQINQPISFSIDTLGFTPEISAIISGVSGAGINKTDAGTLTLSAANTYTGITTISGGTLSLSGGSDCILDSSAVYIASGATLALASNQTIQDLTGAEGSFVNLGTSQLTFGTANNQTFAGQISGSGLDSLLKQGSGVVTLTGDSDYTGATTLTAGTLEIAQNTSIGASSADLLVTGNATLAVDYSGSMDHPITIYPLITLSIDPLDHDVSISQSIGAPSGSLQEIGSGQLILEATNTYTGTTTIAGGTLTLASLSSDCISASSLVTIDAGGTLALASNQTIQDLSGASGSFINLGSSELTFGTGNSEVFRGVIYGNGSLVKQGTGDEQLWGANIYTGGTTISAGSLTVKGLNGSLPSGGALDIALNALFDMSSLLAPVHQTIGDLTGLGQIKLGPHVLTFGTDNGTPQEFGGAITGLGIVIKQGSGEALFSGNNAYSGGTVVANGELSMSLNGLLASSGTVQINSGATFTIATSIVAPYFTIGDLTGSGFVTLGTNTLAFGTSRNRTFSGVISGSGSILKLGSGIATLTGANLFTGGAEVAQGALAINGSLVCPVTVDSGATLQGTGVINDLVTVNDGGTIQPGNSIGTLTMTNLTLAPLSNTLITLQPLMANQSNASSSLQVTNTAIVDGTLVIDAAPGFYPANTSYTILTAGSSLTGAFSPTVVFVSGSQELIPYSILYDYIATPKTIMFFTGNVPPPFIDINLLKGNQNAERLALYLNQLSSDLILGPVVFDLSKLPANQLLTSLESISPARIAIGRFVAQNTMFLVASTVSCRMAQQRLIMRDVQMENTVAPEQFWTGLSPHASAAKISTAERHFSSSTPPFWASAAYQETIKQEEDPSSTYSSPYGKEKVLVKDKQHYAFWGEGIGEWIYQDARHENPAYAAYTGGGLLGCDYYGEDGLLGAAVGYIKSRIQEDHGAGNGTVDYYAASLYGTIYAGDGYAEVGLAGSFNDFYNQRHVAYQQYGGGVFDAIAVSSPWGAEFVPHIGLGYDWNFPWATLEPFLSLDCALLYQSSFTERNAFPLNMHVPSSWSGLLRTELGLNAYQVWTTTRGDIVLRETLSYVNKRPYGVGKIFANIVDYPPGFALNSFVNIQNFFSPGFQFLYRAPGGGFISLSYMGEFQEGSNKYISHNALGQIGVYF